MDPLPHLIPEIDKLRANLREEEYTQDEILEQIHFYRAKRTAAEIELSYWEDLLARRRKEENL